MRIIHDLQRFNEEQLKILISLAHKVRHSKRMLTRVAAEAEQMMFDMPAGRSIVKPEPEQLALEHTINVEEKEKREGARASE
jgi:hypothetical protein